MVTPVERDDSMIELSNSPYVRGGGDAVDLQRQSVGGRSGPLAFYLYTN